MNETWLDETIINTVITYGECVFGEGNYDNYVFFESENPEQTWTIQTAENVTFIEVENSKHEILNQDTRPFVLSEIHQWLRKNKLV